MKSVSGGDKSQYLYILEKDTKAVIEFNMTTKNVLMRQVTIANKYPHNFQYCQTPSGQIYVVGGGDHQQAKTLTSLKDCYRIIPTPTGNYQSEKVCDLKYGRHGHSLCCLKDKFLICTGSRVEHEEAYKKCEMYNISLDLWFDIPELNEGRHYHASCTFNDRYVYVFCGISSIAKKNYCNTIEIFDNDTKRPWELVKVAQSTFPARQGVGAI